MLNAINIGLLGFQMNTVVFVVALIACLLVGAVVGFFACKAIIVKKINNAKNSASKIIEDAHLEAKTILKEARLSAQEESIKIKTETENELKERRIEIEKLNDRFLQREEFVNNREQSLEKKNDNLEKFKEKLEQKEKTLQQKESDLEKKENEIITQLEKVASLTKEQAKQQLITQITDEAKLDSILLVKEIEQNAKDNAHKIVGIRRSQKTPLIGKETLPMSGMFVS